MKQKKLLGIILISISFVAFSLAGLITWTREGNFISFKYTSHNSLINNNFLIDKKIPGIVEGSARMINTATIFKEQTPSISTTRIHLVGANVSNLKVTIGYKSANYDLLEVPLNTEDKKETTIWTGQDNYPLASQDLYIINNNTVSKELDIIWDLTAVGFDSIDYIKADERIWYLRIERIKNNSLGEYINHTMTIDGETYTVDEYKPYIYFLESFEVQFGDLVFHSLLHPFFDGSTEIVVPIRGVDHELVVTNDNKNTPLTKDFRTTAWEENESHSGAIERWCVVYGCSASGLDSSMPQVESCGWACVECCAFILGCSPKKTGLAEWQYYGVYDYGWNVAYCMDEDNKEHPLETCDEVDDDYFKEMLDFVDGKLGPNDELIVLTHTHGGYHDNEHFTYSTKSKRHTFLWWNWYTNVIFCTSHGSCTSYFDEIGDITTDGTYVFLIVLTCHSSRYDSHVSIGIDSFPSNKHNNHLFTWCYSELLGICGSKNHYEAFYWYDDITQHFKSLSYLFYNSFYNLIINAITNIIDNDNFYNSLFHFGDYWNNYPLKLRNAFTIENFDLFYLFESNEYIVSSHTNDQIQFTYVNSGPSYTLITESYLLEIPRTTANFHVEITADWSVCSDFPKWNSLLEVGIVDFSSSTFSPYLSIGTKDDTYSETGCFQAKLGSNWHYDTDPDEVLQSRTNVNYILSYTNGQFLCRIKQGTTILYQVFGYTSDYDSINSILIKYQHRTRTASTASYWTIKAIYAEITY